MMVKVRTEAFSLQQAADLLGVNVMTVRRWIKKDTIRAFRAGKKLWRVPLDEIQKMKKARDS